MVVVQVDDTQTAAAEIEEEAAVVEIASNPAGRRQDLMKIDQVAEGVEEGPRWKVREPLVGTLVPTSSPGTRS